MSVPTRRPRRLGTRRPGRLTTGVVALTLVVQGFTLAPLVRRSGIALEPEHTAREEARARGSLAHAALLHLDKLIDLEAVPTAVADQLRRDLENRLGAEDGAGAGETAGMRFAVADHRAMRRALIGVESEELQRLYETHEISDTTRRRIQRSLDLEDLGLAD